MDLKMLVIDPFLNTQQDFRSTTNKRKNNTSNHVKVERVNVKSVNYTKRELIDRVLKPIKECTTAIDLDEEIRKAIARLELIYGPGKIEASISNEKKTPDNVQVLEIDVNIDEGKRFSLRSGCEVGAGDLGTNVLLKCNNALGNLESVEASYNYDVNVADGVDTRKISGYSRKKTYAVSLTKRLVRKFEVSEPLSGRDVSSFSLNISSAANPNKCIRAYSEAVKSASLSYNLGVLPLGHHQISYEYVWRNLHDLCPDTPWSIRMFAGVNTKSSLKYSYSFDTRKNSEGYAYKVSTETAGLGGNCRHLKLDAAVALAKILFGKWPASFTFRLGLLARNPQSHPSHVSDRFFFGNTRRIRGFFSDKTGPVYNRYHIGSDAFWSASVSLFTPIPKIASENVKGHLFLNFGGLASDQYKTLPTLIRSAASHFILSAGGGIAFSVGNATLELNYSLPLICSTTDITCPGFGVNIGVDLL